MLRSSSWSKKWVKINTFILFSLMIIKIHQRNSDKNNTELYKSAIEMFADLLIPKTKQEKLKLSLIIKNWADDDDLGEIHQISRNNYKIYINKNSPFNKIINTIAHEMVHVRQGVNKQLTMVANGFIWKGDRYINIDFDNTEVYNQYPWEIEANSESIDLTLKFFKKYVMQNFV